MHGTCPRGGVISGGGCRTPQGSHVNGRGQPATRAATRPSRSVTGFASTSRRQAGISRQRTTLATGSREPRGNIPTSDSDSSAISSNGSRASRFGITPGSTSSNPWASGTSAGSGPISTRRPTRRPISRSARKRRRASRTPVRRALSTARRSTIRLWATSRRFAGTTSPTIQTAHFGSAPTTWAAS